MIKVESLTIEEFRGLRKLTLPLRGKNFAVCGPNGTGKSGVVDALEFVLTGTISRLTGKGSKEISVQEHGPHVDSRDAPDKAKVTAKVLVGEHKKRATITRTIGSAQKPVIEPSDKDLVEALAAVEAQADFVLSRRELIRYVLATPGDRAAEVRALLRLEEVEKVRATLLKSANTLKRRLGDAELAQKSARTALMTATGITAFTPAELLKAVNVKRRLAGVPELQIFESTTSLKDGLASHAAALSSPLSKQQAMNDLQSWVEGLKIVENDRESGVVGEVRKVAEQLQQNPLTKDALERDEFLAAGLGLLHDAECPFCNTAWDLEQLRRHVLEKQEALAQVRADRAALEAKLDPLREHLMSLEDALKALEAHAKRATPPVVFTSVGTLIKALNSAQSTIAAVLPLEDLLKALDSAFAVPDSVRKEIAALHSVVVALPEPSQTEAARDWLIVAQEKLEADRAAERATQLASRAHLQSRTIADVFATTSDGVLKGLYESVQTDFSTLYAAINQEDEGKFSAQLLPAQSTLGFKVDFYNRGFFPPGAYHSEGHQDGMGLCLYLALMKYMHGPAFRLAVLDDVLMSVDAGHRREVCRVLREHFPDTQFVLTTHDRVWLKHMRSAGLIGDNAAIEFRKWDVASGPVDWDEKEVWEDIAADLKSNKVEGAAGTLRRYLEHEAVELCDSLRARVEFRGDGQYQLEDVLPMAVQQLRKHYERGIDAAHSWKRSDVEDALRLRLEAFEQIVKTSNVERWQINAAVHYNEWVSLVKEDFLPVVASFRALVDSFRCQGCRLFLWATRSRGSAEAVRCGCDKASFSLLRKKDI